MRARWLLSLLACACSEPLHVGSDLLWTADTEVGSLEQWTASGSGESLAPTTGAKAPNPNQASSIEASTEAAHSGKYAVKLVNPTGWNDDFEGPELIHTAGTLADAYYSAWFLLPTAQRVDPYITVMRLRARGEDGSLNNGEELQLRSLPSGDYVVSVFHNNSSFLLEPVANPAPHVQADRWFQLEARYEAQSGGRLRVWVDGTLYYDLTGRPGAAGPEVVLSVCNVGKASTPANTPVLLFVDDAAISSSRVGPAGTLHD